MLFNIDAKHAQVWFCHWSANIKGSSLRNCLAKLNILHGLLPFLLASVDFIQKSDCIPRIETKQHQTLNIASKVYVMGLLSKYL